MPKFYDAAFAAPARTPNIRTHLNRDFHKTKHV